MFNPFKFIDTKEMSKEFEEELLERFAAAVSEINIPARCCFDYAEKMIDEYCLRTGLTRSKNRKTTYPCICKSKA